jgi:hypothetical protein
MRTQTPPLAELPTADDFRAIHFVDFRAVHFVAERPAPSEDIVAQPPKIVAVAERPAPSEDIVAQPPKIVTDFDTTRFLYRMR